MERRRRACGHKNAPKSLLIRSSYSSFLTIPKANTHSLPFVEFFIQILETLGLCEMRDRLTTVPSGLVSSSSLTDTTVSELPPFCSERRVPQLKDTSRPTSTFLSFRAIFGENGVCSKPEKAKINLSLLVGRSIQTAIEDGVIQSYFCRDEFRDSEFVVSSGLSSSSWRNAMQ